MTLELTAYEAHAEGEPGRVIVSGHSDGLDLGTLPGASVFEQMQYLQTNADHIRTLILREPRGYPALCANILTKPCHPDADLGLIIMEQSEYAPMSGSNLICAVTVALETGIIEMQHPQTFLNVETPAGLVAVTATCVGSKVTKVTFRNVPAFALHLDAPLEVPGLGGIKVDVAWGGMFFVLANADDLGISLDAENGREICRVSEAIRHAATLQLPVNHPENPELTGPTITNLWGAATAKGVDGRGAITLSTGRFDPKHPENASGILDRCPCGTGTCAKMAVLHAKGLLNVGQTYVNAGPLGTTFEARIEEETSVGPFKAIIPSLSGQAWIYGKSTYTLDPTDPFPNGFTPSDLW